MTQCATRRCRQQILAEYAALFRLRARLGSLILVAKHGFVVLATVEYAENCDDASIDPESDRDTSTKSDRSQTRTQVTSLGCAFRPKVKLHAMIDGRIDKAISGDRSLFGDR
jgi:hypothetical protein